MTRNLLLQFHVSPEERQEIVRLAQAAKLSLAQWLRQTALSSAVYPLATASETQPRAVSANRTKDNSHLSKLCPRCQRFGQPACNPCRKLLSY